MREMLFVVNVRLFVVKEKNLYILLMMKMYILFFSYTYNPESKNNAAIFVVVYFV